MTDAWTAAGIDAVSRMGATLRRHPRRVAAAVASFLAFGGSVAFAVANYAPDAALMPVRTVVEAVEPLPLQGQIDALESHSLRLHRFDVVRSTDTADTLLRRLGIADLQAAAVLRADPGFRTQVLGRQGRTVTAEADDSNRLLRLSVRSLIDDDSRQFRRWVFERNGDGLTSGFNTRLEVAPLTASVQIGSGTIRTSLFAATDESRIPDSVAVQLAEIFSGDIDFHRALRKGDRFSVVYETLEADGEPLRAGRVLSAEFVNNGKTYQAMWFQEPGKKGGYYTLDGQSLRRAYLASPLEFSRVSSGFKMRFHPILQTWRAHLGVDYAAPTGTPVRVVGDGVVEFAGAQGGFGNVVYVRHANNHTTVYAHLSKINVRKGQSVSQGQNIGAVGATGWATGPHLHFEFRVNGRHQDPMTIARQAEAVPVSAAARPAFDAAAQGHRTALASAASVQFASVE